MRLEHPSNPATHAFTASASSSATASAPRRDAAARGGSRRGLPLGDIALAWLAAVAAITVLIDFVATY